VSYEIVSFKLSEGVSMDILVSTGRKTFMEKLAGNPKDQNRAAVIAKTADRVGRNGISWAKASKTLKAITATVSVFELRVPGKVIRVMTYVHDGETPVYLFDFDGHQGKGGKIPQSLIDKANTLAEAARECIAREGLPR
jgi:hypothetical protein